MKHSLIQTPTDVPRRRDFTVASILIDFADTTWRMAAPVILFTVVGLLVDRKLGSKPWVTLLGTAVGFVFAVLLVKRQLDAASRRDA